MSPVLPLHAFVVDQPHVGLVDQRRRLQAVAGLLALHVVVRQTWSSSYTIGVGRASARWSPSVHARSNALTSSGSGSPVLRPSGMVVGRGIISAFSISAYVSSPQR